METIELRTLVIGLLFLFTLISGVWLSNSGKPINAVILAIHKVLSFLTAFFIAVTIYPRHVDVGLSTIEFSAIVVTGLTFLVAIISGGWLSIGKPANVVVLTIHKVTPFLIALSTTATIYLLANG